MPEAHCTCPAHYRRGDGSFDEDCPRHGDHEWQPSDLASAEARL